MKNSRKTIFFVYIRGFNLSEGQAEQMKSAGNENRVIRDLYKLLLQNNDKIGLNDYCVACFAKLYILNY